MERRLRVFVFGFIFVEIGLCSGALRRDADLRGHVEVLLLAIAATAASTTPTATATFAVTLTGSARFTFVDDNCIGQMLRLRLGDERRIFGLFLFGCLRDTDRRTRLLHRCRFGG